MSAKDLGVFFRIVNFVRTAVTGIIRKDNRQVWIESAAKIVLGNEIARLIQITKRQIFG